ncbi:MAG: DUF2252 family protein, partial [Myxococcota bacterium]
MRPLMPTLVFLCSCAPASSDRAIWLRHQIVAENMLWLPRNPDGLAAKYQKMAADPYDYMRGTAGTYYVDLTRTADIREETVFLNTPEANQILLIGDAHPENVGTMLPGDARPPFDDREVVVTFNDLDASIYGPWLLDLRRSAVGVAVLTLGLAGCDDGCRGAIRDAQIDGYRAGALGDPRPTDVGEVIVDMVEEAEEEGPAQDKLLRYTTLDDNDQRVLIFDQDLDEDGQAIFPLSDAERAQVDRLMADYPKPDGFRLLDVGRRFGSGVSSLPATRYIIVWDQGDPDDADDRLLNVREVLDPPAVGRLFAETGDRFIDNADRIEAVSAHVWAPDDADGAAAGMRDEPLAFKALSWTSWFQDLDHED